MCRRVCANRNQQPEIDDGERQRPLVFWALLLAVGARQGKAETRPMDIAIGFQRRSAQPANQAGTPGMARPHLCYRADGILGFHSPFRSIYDDNP